MISVSDICDRLIAVNEEITSTAQRIEQYEGEIQRLMSQINSEFGDDDRANSAIRILNESLTSLSDAEHCLSNINPQIHEYIRHCTK